MKRIFNKVWFCRMFHSAVGTSDNNWYCKKWCDKMQTFRFNLDKADTYTVHVICWDGVDYLREATKDEIDTQRKNGYVKEDGYFGITFNFRSSHGI